MSTNKLRLIEEIEYNTNFNKIGEKILEWSNDSENKDLKMCRDCLARIGVYVAKLETDRRNFDKALEEYQLRIHKLQNHVFDMKKQIAELKNKSTNMEKEILDSFSESLKKENNN
jgi:peptidoglycan hydrolase CwlO-like protein